MPWLSNIANKFAKTAKPFGTRVPLTLRYALAIPSVSRSVGLTFLTSPATGTKKSKFFLNLLFLFRCTGENNFSQREKCSENACVLPKGNKHLA